MEIVKKRKKMLVWAAACCLSLAPMTGSAQTTETDDYYFRFRQVIFTKRTYDNLFQAESYTGDELRAGILSYQWGVVADKKRKDAVIDTPERADLEMTITDQDRGRRTGQADT